MTRRKEDWEVIIDDEGEGSGCAVRRLAVPGGWLYQVSMDNLTISTLDGRGGSTQYGWSPPVFVADPEERNVPTGRREIP